MSSEATVKRIEDLEESCLELAVLLGIAYQQAFDKTTDEVLDQIFTSPAQIQAIKDGMKDNRNLAILHRVVTKYNPPSQARN